MKPQKLIKETNLYFPKVVRMKMPGSVTGQN
jgi:hypothetical protein